MSDERPPPLLAAVFVGFMFGVLVTGFVQDRHWQTELVARGYAHYSIEHQWKCNGEK